MANKDELVRVNSLITVLAVEFTPIFKHFSVVLYVWTRKSRQYLLSLLQGVDGTWSDFVLTICSFAKI